MWQVSSCTGMAERPLFLPFIWAGYSWSSDHRRTFSQAGRYVLKAGLLSGRQSEARSRSCQHSDVSEPWSATSVLILVEHP